MLFAFTPESRSPSPGIRTVTSEIASLTKNSLANKHFLGQIKTGSTGRLHRLIQALDDPATPCLLAPLDRLVADALESVSRNEVPDLPDRIVTATAVALRVPLISRDRKIRSPQIQTIW
jgi:hypothetical protein